MRIRVMQQVDAGTLLERPWRSSSTRHIRPGVLLVGAVLALIHGGVAFGTQAPRRPAPAPGPDFASAEVRSMHVKGNVYVLEGVGGNVTVHIGPQGVLIVDTQFAPMADRILAEIRKLAGDKPLRFIINTHSHADHIGGNELIARTGSKVFGGNERAANPAGGQGATVIAHENLQFNLLKLDNTPEATAPGNWPTEFYSGNRYDLHFNGEPVMLMHQPAAHTDADTVVHFRSSDVISTGDVYITNRYPFVDASRGGTINGIIDALNRIIDIAVPEKDQEGGTMIIPGHGRVGDESDVVEYRDMVTIIRNRIQAMVEKGLTLEQVRAARPTQDYDARFGATTGFWTTGMFIDVIFQQLRDAANGGPKGE